MTREPIAYILNSPRRPGICGVRSPGGSDESRTISSTLTGTVVGGPAYVHHREACLEFPAARPAPYSRSCSVCRLLQNPMLSLAIALCSSDTPDAERTSSTHCSALTPTLMLMTSRLRLLARRVVKVEDMTGGMERLRRFPLPSLGVVRRAGSGDGRDSLLSLRCEDLELCGSCSPARLA